MRTYALVLLMLFSPVVRAEALETADNQATNVVSGIASGLEHSCAIFDGAAWCWGGNKYGELGNGTTSASREPVQVQGLSSGVTAIVAQGNYTCAIHAGAAKCWGRNYNGSLGSGSTSDSTIPVQVQGLTSGVTSISTGCAVQNGAAKCWGTTAYGRLGDGSMGTGLDAEVRLSPVQVHGLTSGVTAISSGIHNTCAIQGGSVKCWGSNFYGSLGNSTTTTMSIPAQVVGLESGVTAIANAGYSTCAIQNGGVKCWGINSLGNLGNGKASKAVSLSDMPLISTTPVDVLGLDSGVTAISSGDHTCVIHNDSLNAGDTTSMGNSETAQHPQAQFLFRYPGRKVG